MSKRTRSPSPVTFRTRANNVSRDTTSPDDADFIGLALDLFRLFNHFGSDILKLLTKFVVKAELDDRVHLHYVDGPRAPPKAMTMTTKPTDHFFDNTFVIRRTKWWSRLFANILRLRSAHSTLDDYERNFWINFNMVVGTIKPKAPFILYRSMPGRHFLGEWMRFSAPLVRARLFHLDGTEHYHEYYPASMPAEEFYAHFPTTLPDLDEIIDCCSREIEVVPPPNGYAGGPGLPFSSVSARALREGEEDYTLTKRMVVWKKHTTLVPGRNNSLLEWKVDREIGKGLVDDFNSDQEDED